MRKNINFISMVVAAGIMIGVIFRYADAQVRVNPTRSSSVDLTAPGPIGGTTASTGQFSFIGVAHMSVTGMLSATAASFTTASTTTLNLNGTSRSSWPAGSDLTNPGPIGSVTPDTGAFTSLSANTATLTSMISTSATFTNVMATSTYTVNLNAKYVYMDDGVATNGDLYGFIGNGQSSLVKSGPTGYVLTSQGTGTMPAWKVAGGVSSNYTLAFTSVTHTTISPATTAASPGIWVGDISITPTSASNKVYINSSSYIFGDAGTQCGWLLRRSLSGTYTDLITSTRAVMGQASASGNSSSISYLDSPATTSAIKYSIWIFKAAGPSNCYGIVATGETLTISIAEISP